ncbi:hypothetical protein B0H34DRAFT_673252 [Crassisporium funariophilum]|nr:hypothetical protein B0H34DRAFT_673252 [Crassisporium funariophilum]
MASSLKTKELMYKLSEILQAPPYASLTSLEILPGGLNEWESIELPPGSTKPHPGFPFVLVEGNLGIPKKILYALYTVAIAIPLRTADPHDAAAASCVILILNPAHQTALNTRKRLIQRNYLDPKKELVLTELLVRGVTDCAKQSIIWDHRRWCLVRLHGVHGPNTSAPILQQWASSEEIERFPKLIPADIRHELSILQATCEASPRNYHAWAHWHFTINVCLASIYSSDNTITRRDFLGIMVEEFARLRSWLDHHVSDYSAMHQICQIQKVMHHLVKMEMLPVEEGNSLSDLSNHSLALLTAFPSHESLWMYLRITLEKSQTEQRSRILEQVEAQALSTDNRFEKQLVAWCTMQQSRESC